VIELRYSETGRSQLIVILDQSLPIPPGNAAIARMLSRAPTAWLAQRNCDRVTREAGVYFSTTVRACE
jgi:hypothetical protein